MKQVEGFEQGPNLTAAKALLEYAQYLLDDEQNLTRVGNLSGKAKELLRARCLELLGASEANPETE